VNRSLAVIVGAGMLVAVRTALVLLALAGSAHADSVAGLQSALPSGWTLKVTKPATDGRGELAIVHTAPVKIAGVFYMNAPYTTNVPRTAPAGAPTITLQLRYGIEARWSEARLEKVRAANNVIYKQLDGLRAKYRIDDIKTGKGMPLPSTPDEEKRLADYQAEYDKTIAKVTRVPRCTLGELSLFDDEHTYEQLKYQVEPASAMREAFAIVELVKRRCPKPSK
jgi:hypothetical protein